MIDVRGRPCPAPVIELAKAIEAADVGDVVEVLSDDPASEVDIPVWCRMKRQTLRSQDAAEGGGWRYAVEKTSQ